MHVQGTAERKTGDKMVLQPERIAVLGTQITVQLITYAAYSVRYPPISPLLHKMENAGMREKHPEC